jgi:hypothetical protein
MIRNKLNVVHGIRNLQYKSAQRRQIETAKQTNDICIAYHGLERNGTNYLARCLKSVTLNILNDHITDRKSFGHKHYRWYSSKDSIIRHYQRYYKTSLGTVNLSTLNKLCDFPENTIHVVIMKEAESACVSFMNFAIRGLYYVDKRAALKDKKCILKDYQEYYQFWENLRKAYSKNVWIIRYENFDTEFTEFVQEVFPDTGKQKSASTYFERVHMSPSHREIYVYPEDLA